MLERCEVFSSKALVSESDFSSEPSAPAITAGLPGTCTDVEKTKAKTSGPLNFKESGRQTVQRFLFPGGDVSTMLPADLWLEELLTPSLTQRREGYLSNLQEQTHSITTKRGPQERKKLLQWAWKKIPGIFV